MPPGDQGRRRPRRRRRLCFQLAKRHRTRLAHTASPAGWGQGWRPAGGRGEMGAEVWGRWLAELARCWGALEVSCLGRRHRGWNRDGEGEEGMCWPYWSHPARRVQLRPEEATGFGRVPTLPEWGRHPRSWRFFPREAELPGHSAGWQRAPAASPERRSCRLSFLGRGVVSLLSACFRQASLRHSRGTGGPPWPRGGTWRLRWVSKPGLGACPAMQRSSLQYSIWELWLVPFLQKPTQESKVIPAWVGAFQSGQRNDPRIVGRGCSPSFGND